MVGLLHDALGNVLLRDVVLLHGIVDGLRRLRANVDVGRLRGHMVLHLRLAHAD